MKYTMVKQFSNGAVDNIFSFLFKWVDFGKMFLEFLWSFLEIWIAFFLIFYNIYMYLYYLFLFLIDRGSETSAGYLHFRGSYGKVSYLSRREQSSGPVVDHLYRPTASDRVLMRTRGEAGNMLTAVRSTAPQGIKKSIFPFKKFIPLFDRGAEREKRAAETDDSKSLIDEYIKEYEYRKK